MMINQFNPKRSHTRAGALDDNYDLLYPRLDS